MTFRNEQVSSRETAKILEILTDCLSRGVLGDVAEFGCYTGDTSLCLAEVLQVYNSRRAESWEAAKNQSEQALDTAGTLAVREVMKKPSAKRLFVYDAFLGLPEKTAEDMSELGTDFQKGALSTTKTEFKKRFLRANLPVPVIKKAWFSRLKSVDLPEQISFAFLDGDFYQSIKISLKLVGPRLTDGAVTIVHDYHNPALPGVARAVDEWLEKNPKFKTQIFESMMILRE